MYILYSVFGFKCHMQNIIIFPTFRLCKVINALSIQQFSPSPNLTFSPHNMHLISSHPQLTLTTSSQTTGEPQPTASLTHCSSRSCIKDNSASGCENWIEREGYPVGVNCRLDTVIHRIRTRAKMGRFNPMDIPTALPSNRQSFLLLKKNCARRLKTS